MSDWPDWSDSSDSSDCLEHSELKVDWMDGWILLRRLVHLEHLAVLITLYEAECDGSCRYIRQTKWPYMEKVGTSDGGKADFSVSSV